VCFVHPGRIHVKDYIADTLITMPKLRRTVVVVAAALLTAVVCWYLWPENDDPQLVAGPISVSFDQSTARLTAIVNIQNSGGSPIIASITNDVFVDSQKQRLNDPRQPQPWRAELGSKQLSPVTFILQGHSAAEVWNGVRLMEVTINARYDGDAKQSCHFSFMGRFYPELKQIGTVSNVTSPRACRDR
jgi:hypothetical protein